MLVLTSKYGSLIDIDILKKQKKEPLIKHRLTIDLNEYNDIKEAYLIFLNNRDKYVIGYKPKDRLEIKYFVNYLGEIDTLDVSWIDVRELNRLADCFEYCKAKHIVGLDNWDVSRVRDISFMFSHCDNLESIEDISRWDVSNVETMSFMFNDCLNLNSIGDISGWDVRNVVEMQFMFKECKSLKNVGDLDRWNLHVNVDNRHMFRDSAIKHRTSWYKTY